MENFILFLWTSVATDPWFGTKNMDQPDFLPSLDPGLYIVALAEYLHICGSMKSLECGHLWFPLD